MINHFCLLLVMVFAAITYGKTIKIDCGWDDCEQKCQQQNLKFVLQSQYCTNSKCVEGSDSHPCTCTALCQDKEASECGKQDQDYQSDVEINADGKLTGHFLNKTLPNGTINFVYNGRKSPPHSWPWSIWMGNCGAALLSLEWAITADHCVPGGRKTLKFGIHMKTDIPEFECEINDENVIKPPVSLCNKNQRFTEPGNFQFCKPDVALISISHCRIHRTKKVKPICLPLEDDNWRVDGQLLAAAGWGSVDDTKHINSDQLLETILETLWDNLEKYQSTFFKKPASMIPWNIPGQISMFATKPLKDLVPGDVCHGDSGSPIMAYKFGQWTLAGLVSYGPACSNTNIGMLSHIPEVRKWIAAKTGL